MTDNELTQLLADESWEYKKMGDVALEMYTGSIPKISERKEGKIPTIQLKDISDLKSPFIYECKTFLDDSNIKNKKVATRGDLLMIYDSSIKIVGRTFIYMGEQECIVGNCIHVIKHQHNASYLLHALNLPHIQHKIKTIAGIKNRMYGLFGTIRIQELKHISIPLPSLAVQNKIANYLDNLLLGELKLSDSLEKMMEIRKKQYEFYKEQILTSEMDK